MLCGWEALKCGGKVPPKQIHLGGFGRKVALFAQRAKKNSLGGKFWAKNSDRPYAGTDDNSPFRQFFRL
jgi:hypothetical protein